MPEKSRQKSYSVTGPTFWILLLFGILLCGSGFLLDAHVIAWVTEHGSRRASRVAGFLSNYGDWPELMVLGGVGLGISLWRKNLDLRRIVICMMVSATIAGALVNSVRIVSGRARPNNTQATQEWNGLWHDGTLLLFKNKYHSFPSGHTASAFGFFGVVAFARRSYGWLFLLMAAAIGWSRIQLNAHHLSDVLTGMVVGITVAYLTWTKGMSNGEGRRAK
jgi:membrane-associated phospholipid phosphatase